MERINSTNKEVDLFGAGKHGFRDGNPGLGVFPTFLSAAWFNALQEEVANTVEFAGIALNAGDRTQLRQAVQKLITDAQKLVSIPNAVFEASVSNSEVVRWDSGNSRFDEAIADGTANEKGIGVADVSNSKVYLYGETPALFSGLTPGAEYYLSDVTPGSITSVKPARAIKIGIAKSATVLWVDPDDLTAAAASDTASGAIELAVQAEMEAATDNVRAVTPGRLNFHPGVAKGFAVVTVSGGTPTLAANRNVSSIVDNGVADFTINWTTAFSSANYALGQMSGDYTTAQSLRGTMIHTQAAGSLRLIHATNLAEDPTRFSIVAFGDQ